MVYLVLLVSLAGFLLSIRITGIISQVHTAAADARQALIVMRNVDMSEDEKETLVQAAALRMFILFFGILIRATVAVAVSILLVLIAVWAGLCTMEAVEAGLTNWIFLTSAVVITLLMWRVIK